MDLLSFQSYVPKDLNNIVKSFWFLEVGRECGPFYEEEIIPDGHHEIIFQLDSTANRKPAGGEWLKEPMAMVAGQTLKSHGLRLAPGSRLLGIRFYPHTLSTLFDFPASELNNNIVGLDEVAKASIFWNGVTDDPLKTFSAFERLLSEKLIRRRAISNDFTYVNAAVSDILDTNGNVTVDQLIKKTGISAKHLDDSFRRYVGLTPKKLAGIVKFNSFISYKKDHPEKTFTECCYAADYYDQSHLIKAFRNFTDKSPTEYFAEAELISGIFSRI